MNRKILSVIGSLAVSAGLLLAGAGTADAATSTVQKGTGTTPAALQPLVGTVTAKFRVVDSGKTLRVIGSATGLDRGSNYVSLIYPDDACNSAETPIGFTVDGLFQEIGDSQRDVNARYDGTAYAAVKGKVGSVSVRRIDLVLVPSATGPAVVTATLTPVVCVDVK